MMMFIHLVLILSSMDLLTLQIPKYSLRVLALCLVKHLHQTKVIHLVLVWTLQEEKLLEKPEPSVRVLTFQPNQTTWELLLTHSLNTCTCHPLRYLVYYKHLMSIHILVMIQTLLVQFRRLQMGHTLVTAQLLRLDKNYQQTLFHHLD